MRRIAALVALCLLASPLARAEVTRTETRAPCANAHPLRGPFFGDAHVDTAVSFEAMAQGTRAARKSGRRA